MKRILAILLTLIPSVAFAQPDWGVYPDGGTLYFYSNTVGTDGVAETIASEAIAVYKDNSDTELTTGASIDDDVDSKTGFHRIAIDTTQSGFDAGSTYTVIYTAGTVDSVSVVGRIIGSFRLGVVPANVTTWSGTAVATPDTAGYPKVTIKDGTGTGEIDTASGLVLADVNKWLGTTVATPTTNGVPEVDVTHYVGALVASPAVTGIPDVNMRYISTDQTAADNCESFFDGTGYAGTNNTIGWNASWDAEVQSEVQDAIEVNQLDHLIAVADPGGIVANSSLWAKLHSKSATPAYTSYNNTTDSLEAISDGAGGGGNPWSTAVSGNTTSGTFGELIYRIKQGQR